MGGGEIPIPKEELSIMYNWLVRIDTVHVGRRIHVDSSFQESGRLGDYIFLGSFKDGKYREGKKDRINPIEGVFEVLDSEIIINCPNNYIPVSHGNNVLGIFSATLCYTYDS